jgi:tetratricopeptide (TPR) repeat protein
MEIGLQKSVRPRQASVDLDRLIECYQLADSAPAHAFVTTLSPDLLRFFRSQVASRQQAADLLREPWMRNHRVRHTYRPGDPLTKKDARLRLRCLTVKGDVDLDFDTALAARDWTEALSIAKDLEDPSWVNRANGELGIISFVQGDYRNGTVRVMGALSQAKKPNDIGAQIRYLTLVGDGLIQLQRNEQAIAMFDQALAVAQTIPELGQPVMTYAGKAQALAALGRTAEAKKLLESVFEISHQRSAPFLDARRALKNKVAKASKRHSRTHRQACE